MLSKLKQIFLVNILQLNAFPQGKESSTAIVMGSTIMYLFQLTKYQCLNYKLQVIVSF